MHENILAKAKLLKDKHFRYLFIVSVAAPPVILAILIAVLARNIPILDQWEFATFIQKYHQSGVTLADFFAQHNEHRLFFPRLVMFVLALLSSWNTVWEVWASLAFACASFAFLVLILKKTFLSKTAFLFAAATTSFIFFSPMQFENWLWGWQVQWFLNIFGLILAVWALTTWNAAVHKRVLLAALGAVVATFSLGSGFFVWLVCAPLFIIKPLRTWAPLWVLLAASAVVFYYFGYQSPADHPLLLFVHKPVEFIHYIIVYLAHPLAFQSSLTYAGLFIMVLSLAGGFWYVWHWAKSQLTTLLPWMCLGLYAILAATSTAITRLTLGVEQAYSSRYTTISLLLTLTLIVILYKVLELRPPKTYLRNIVIGLIVAATLLIGVNYAKGIVQMWRHSDYLKTVQVCAHNATSANDPCLQALYPWPNLLWPRLEYLRSIHWAGQ